ncbi:MAG: hypothetical protein WC602_04675 [archaeon]
MENPKKFPGIYIAKPQKRSESLASLPDFVVDPREKKEILLYRISVGEHDAQTAGRALKFITTPKLRKALETISRKGWKFENLPGLVEVIALPEKKQLIFSALYPLQHEKMRGIGAGSLVEYQIQKDIMKRFPGYRVKLTGVRLKPRKRQQRKRGHADLETIEEFAGKTRNYAVATGRKHEGPSLFRRFIRKLR